jgi:Tfp pilus assembly protein PilE
MRLLSWFTPFYITRRCIGFAIVDSSIAWLELLICAAIISILAVTGTGIYREQIRTAEVLRAVAGLPMTDIKTDMMVYHAHTGQWPESEADLRKWPVVPHDAYHPDPAVEELTIEGGALHMVLNGSLAAGIVTVRPGVPGEDPLGPVAWFAGRPLNGTNLSLAGEDRTTIPQRLIHPRLR